MNVFIEAVFVGLSLAVFVRMMKMFDYKFVNNDFVFMFVVGFLIHLVFEVVGLNAKYCELKTKNR